MENFEINPALDTESRPHQIWSCQSPFRSVYFVVCNDVTRFTLLRVSYSVEITFKKKFIIGRYKQKLASCSSFSFSFFSYSISFQQHVILTCWITEWERSLEILVLRVWVHRWHHVFLLSCIIHVIAICIVLKCVHFHHHKFRTLVNVKNFILYNYFNNY